MEKLKYFLAGIIMCIFMGCSSYYTKYDSSSVNQYDYYSYGRKGNHYSGKHENTPIKKTICDKCKIGIVNMICGECRFCGDRTGLKVVKICNECSYETSLCQICLKPIK